MKLLILLAFLFISCNPQKNDIEKGIAEMSEEREEPLEDTVEKEDCIFDTGTYAFTTEVLKGIPDVRDLVWIDSIGTAIVQWRKDEIRRHKGGCTHFSDDIELITRDTTSLENNAYWLGRAKEVATHFGIPHYAQALAVDSVELWQENSNSLVKWYQLTREADRDLLPVIEGIVITRTNDSTIISMDQYIN